MERRAGSIVCARTWTRSPHHRRWGRATTSRGRRRLPRLRARRSYHDAAGRGQEHGRGPRRSPRRTDGPLHLPAGRGGPRRRARDDGRRSLRALPLRRGLRRSQLARRALRDRVRRRRADDGCERQDRDRDHREGSSRCHAAQGRGPGPRREPSSPRSSPSSRAGTDPVDAAVVSITKIEASSAFNVIPETTTSAARCVRSVRDARSARGRDRAHGGRDRPGHGLRGAGGVQPRLPADRQPRRTVRALRRGGAPPARRRAGLDRSRALHGGGLRVHARGGARQLPLARAGRRVQRAPSPVRRRRLLPVGANLWVELVEGFAASRRGPR